MRINSDKIRKKLTPKMSVNDLVRRYINHDGLRRPTRMTRHVGIEVECYGPKPRLELTKLILLMDLEKYIQIGDDSSIRRPRGFHCYELRILLPEGQLSVLLKKIDKLFKTAKLEVNESCGLHVHLDMRCRPYMECYQKLIAAQDLLYAMVSKQRWRNPFCQYVRSIVEFPEKYRAITGSSYRSKGTLEIRLHEGCVDAMKIEKWIKFLLQIVNSASAPAMKKDDVLKWTSRPLRDYVKKTFNEDWQKEKVRYVQTATVQRSSSSDLQW